MRIWPDLLKIPDDPAELKDAKSYLITVPPGSILAIGGRAVRNRNGQEQSLLYRPEGPHGLQQIDGHLPPHLANVYLRSSITPTSKGSDVVPSQRYHGSHLRLVYSHSPR